MTEIIVSCSPNLVLFLIHLLCILLFSILCLSTDVIFCAFIGTQVYLFRYVSLGRVR